MTGKIVGLYQRIPENINPAAFSFYSFSVKWYAISYLAGFLAVYLLLKWRIRKGEGISKLKLPDNKWQDIILDLLFYSFIGLLFGARLGYAFFYDFKYFLDNPIALVSPFDEAGNLAGIYGMSYFGGLIGVVFSGWLYSARKKINFWQLADFVVPAVPAGYFFGRIGNFLNGELYGRPTERTWGMYFPNDSSGLLRHPSQLYEAFFEGIILFIILWALRNKSSVISGRLLAIYLFGYGFFRFFIEFFRESDPQTKLIFDFFTPGQMFSIILFIAAILIYSKARPDPGTS